MCKKVVGIGFCPVDEVIVVPSYPKIGTKISSLFVTRQGGGAVATGLALLSTLRVETQFISTVGDDDLGYYLIEILKQRGVNCDNVNIVKGDVTNRTIIIVDSSNGKATIITPKYRKISGTLKVNPDIFQGAAILHLDGYYSQNAIGLAHIAKKQGALISINAGRARPSIDKFLSLADIVIMSKSFAYEHCQCSSPEIALSRLRQRYQAQILGITLQSDGAICWSNTTGVMAVKAVPVNVRDDSSAGDIFHGAFLYGIVNSWPLYRTLEFANATAAYSCQFYGGREGIPASEEEIWAFLSQKDQ